MEINSGDTTWILVSAALVLMMTPALAFFYGGMVRKKNVLSTLNLSFVLMCLISLQWLLYGYSLARTSASSLGGSILWGSLRWVPRHRIARPQFHIWVSRPSK